ncbi:hypothetical protein BZA77DRAFT_373272 [Pyronema omphalodes]|nr:hypothetical protein BZA77DRAFT_298501 [Pyronema omphalodes]KAI5813744.1 hypothetical protein BZA77DRAFT_373272 [Pyronema omphalodes]
MVPRAYQQSQNSEWPLLKSTLIRAAVNARSNANADANANDKATVNTKANTTATANTIANTNANTNTNTNAKARKYSYLLTPSENTGAGINREVNGTGMNTMDMKGMEVNGMNGMNGLNRYRYTDIEAISYTELYPLYHHQLPSPFQAPANPRPSEHSCYTWEFSYLERRYMALELENRITSNRCYELLREVIVDLKQLLKEAEVLRRKYVPVKKFDAGLGASKMMDRVTLNGWGVKRFMAG